MSEGKRRTETLIAQDVLSLAGYKVPKRVIESWSDKRLEQVVDYAAACHFRANDNRIKIPQRPLGLTKYMVGKK